MKTGKNFIKNFPLSLVIGICVQLFAINAFASSEGISAKDLEDYTYYENTKVIEAINYKKKYYVIDEAVKVYIIDIKEAKGTRVESRILNENGKSVAFNYLLIGQRVHTYGMKLKDGRVAAIKTQLIKRKIDKMKNKNKKSR